MVHKIPPYHYWTLLPPHLYFWHTFRAPPAPGEEIIDLDDQFPSGFHTTDDIIEPKDGLRKSDTQVRNDNRPKDRGLLMIYPLQSNLEMTDEEYARSRQEISASYPLKGKGQLFAFSIVFPRSVAEGGPGKYMVNPLDRRKLLKVEGRKPDSYISKEAIKEIKVLNIAQPNAHNVIFNGKNVENRSQSFNIRGTVAIYASKTVDHSRFDDQETRSKIKEEECAFGCIIGFVDVVDRITEDQVSSKTKKWFHGPYGYVLENVVALNVEVRI